MNVGFAGSERDVLRRSTWVHPAMNMGFASHSRLLQQAPLPTTMRMRMLSLALLFGATAAFAPPVARRMSTRLAAGKKITAPPGFQVPEPQLFAVRDWPTTATGALATGLRFASGVFAVGWSPGLSADSSEYVTAPLLPLLY